MRSPRSTKGKFVEVLLILIVAIGISFFVKTFLVQAFYIPSGSMENTLHVGDRVSVNRLGTITGHGIQRGDVVVFHDSAGWLGDRVFCCTAKGNLTVNGHELDELSYIYGGNKPSEVAFRVEVPLNRIWVMGDHRGNSGDSRFHRDDRNNGFIPVREVVGRAFLLLWPLSRTSVLKRPAGLESANP